jgi:hypothetical protein
MVFNSMPVSQTTSNYTTALESIAIDSRGTVIVGFRVGNEMSIGQFLNNKGASSVDSLFLYVD